MSEPPITIEALSRDPYSIYEKLRESEPLCWIPDLGMWFLTRYEDVRFTLRQTDRFTTDSDDSLIKRTLGTHMLTVDGTEHGRHRRPFQRDFMPDWVNDRIAPSIEHATDLLLAGVMNDDTVELRSALASRISVQTMLIAFGLPSDAEAQFRAWFDLFEAALSNHAGDQLIEFRATAAAEQMRTYFCNALDDPREGSLLEGIRQRASDLNDDEIVRNLSIIFFGGISTVEALILNAAWVLYTDRSVRQEVQQNPASISHLLDETMRWSSPVQSATRHVVRRTELHGKVLEPGDTVNCMLGAANRDSAEFSEPDLFDLHRPNARSQLGFATGPHVCIGRRLALIECEIVLSRLVERFPHAEIVSEQSCPPSGHEFRQPRRLVLNLRPST